MSPDRQAGVILVVVAVLYMAWTRWRDAGERIRQARRDVLDAHKAAITAGFVAEPFDAVRSWHPYAGDYDWDGFAQQCAKEQRP